MNFSFVSCIVIGYLFSQTNSYPTDQKDNLISPSFNDYDEKEEQIGNLLQMVFENMAESQQQEQHIQTRSYPEDTIHKIKIDHYQNIVLANMLYNLSKPRKWNSRIRRSVESESTGNNELVCGTFVPEGAEFQFFLETLVKQQSLNLDLASIRNDENIPVYKCFSENEITNPIM